MSGVLHIPRDAMDKVEGALPRSFVVWLFENVAWSEKVWHWNGREIPLGKGEVFATPSYIAKAMGVGIGTARGLLDKVQAAGVLETLTRCGVTVVRLLTLADAEGAARDKASELKARNSARSNPCPESENTETAASSNVHSEQETKRISKNNLPPYPPQSQTSCASETGGVAEKEEAKPEAPCPADQDAEREAQAALAAFERVAKAQRWRGGSVLTRKRRRRIAACLAECGGLEGWKALLASAAQSSILNRIKPGLDFFLSPECFAKLRAGEYMPPDRHRRPLNAGHGFARGNGAKTEKATQEASERPWRRFMTGQLDFFLSDMPSKALNAGLEEAGKLALRPLEAKAFAVWRWREGQRQA